MKFSRLLKLLIVIPGLLFLSCQEKLETPEQKNIIEEKVVPVETMIIEPQAIKQTIDLTGTLQPVNTITLVAEVSGKIVKVNKNIGDAVTPSDVLAVIDDIIPESQLEQAKSEVLSASNNLEIAQTNLASDKLLYENNDISELAYNNSRLAVKTAEAGHLSALAALKVAQKTFDDTRIKSPLQGAISRKFINEGSMASIGTGLYEVVDIDRLKIELNVAQEYINRIKKNSNVEITIPALNNKVYNGIIKRISPQADLSSGSYLVEAEVENNEQLIKGGMTAKVQIVLANMEDIIVIPEYALLTKNKLNYIYLIDNERAILTKVETGQSGNGLITINNGLQIGDEIVVVGMKNLGVDTKVQIENKQ